MLAAAAAKPQDVGVETGYPASMMPTVAAGPDPVTDVEPFLVQSNEGPIEESGVIVDSSVDPDLIRIDAGAEPPFDIGHYA
ncbi:MAG TPA: hypothetical protein PK177_09865 [Burkholderiaceae bacterium]|nr:hypothetical protein [Burkholderiaceae bacterium]